MSTSFATKLNGKQVTVSVQELKLAPITEKVREDWRCKDLRRAFGTANEEEALDKFINMRGGTEDLKSGRESARIMMYSYARQR